MNTASHQIICVMGPTACGKTDLALFLAKHLPCDIVSVDSAMVYRQMTIGTAKPSADVLREAPHRLIDLCDPSEVYSAGRFCTDATREIQAIVANHRIPLLVGGTMLYFHQLQKGFSDLPTADADIRETISAEANNIGWPALYERLQAVDPVAAEKIKPQDAQRIQRALEVYQMTGKPISYFHQQTHALLSEAYSFINIGLIPKNRAWLHERIALRFEKMLDAGFLDEVRHLHARSDLQSDLPSMRLVGYRQALQYIKGDIDFETMKMKAIAATRQLAKRQLTWLRSWKNLVTLDPSVSEDIGQLALKKILMRMRDANSN